MGELVQKKLVDSIDSSNCIKHLIKSLSDPLLLGLKKRAIKTIVDNLSDLVSLEEWEDLNKSHPSLATEILRTYFMTSCDEKERKDFFAVIIIILTS